MIRDFSIGADVEVFLLDESGKNITAEGIIEGTKDEPFIIEGFRTLSLDCVAAEYTINPVLDKSSFIEENMFMLDYLRNKVNPLLLDFFPCRVFEEDQLQSRSANTFGCEADYSAFTRSINEKPNPNGGLRSIGYHLHLAYPNFELEEAIKYIAACDLFLALPMMLLEPQNDRRNLYGKASCIRFKEYEEGLHGIEYRTLSGYVASSVELLNYAWDGVMQAIDFVNFGKEVENWDEIVDTIDNNRMENVSNLLKKQGVNLSL